MFPQTERNRNKVNNVRNINVFDNNFLDLQPWEEDHKDILQRYDDKSKQKQFEKIKPKQLAQSDIFQRVKHEKITQDFNFTLTKSFYQQKQKDIIQQNQQKQKDSYQFNQNFNHFRNNQIVNKTITRAINNITNSQKQDIAQIIYSQKIMNDVTQDKDQVLNLKDRIKKLVNQQQQFFSEENYQNNKFKDVYKQENILNDYIRKNKKILDYIDNFDFNHIDHQKTISNSQFQTERYQSLETLPKCKIMHQKNLKIKIKQPEDKKENLASKIQFKIADRFKNIKSNQKFTFIPSVKQLNKNFTKTSALF